MNALGILLLYNKEYLLGIQGCIFFAVLVEVIWDEDASARQLRGSQGRCILLSGASEGNRI